MRHSARRPGRPGQPAVIVCHPRTCAADANRLTDGNETFIMKKRTYTRNSVEKRKKRRNDMKKYAFGVDIGGTTCKIGFFETDGHLLDKWEIRTNTAESGASILSDVARAIDNKLAQEGISKEEVEGVGVGVPGPVTSDGVVNRSVNLGWGIVDVEADLGALTGLPVKAGNDANVAALGEMWP